MSDWLPEILEPRLEGYTVLALIDADGRVTRRDVLPAILDDPFYKRILEDAFSDLVEDRRRAVIEGHPSGAGSFEEGSRA